MPEITKTWKGEIVSPYTFLNLIHVITFCYMYHTHRAAALVTPPSICTLWTGLPVWQQMPALETNFLWLNFNELFMSTVANAYDITYVIKLYIIVIKLYIIIELLFLICHKFHLIITPYWKRKNYSYMIRVWVKVAPDRFYTGQLYIVQPVILSVLFLSLSLSSSAEITASAFLVIWYVLLPHPKLIHLCFSLSPWSTVNSRPTVNFSHR